MQNEIELKLLFQPKDQSKLLSLPAIRKLTRGRARTRNLPSVYFETPDLKLRTHNISFRVRKDGRRFIQCVKSAGTQEGGLFIRKEWENPVPTEDPVLPAINDADLRKLLLSCAANRLEPVLRTEIRRTTRQLVVEGSEITMDIDTGEVVTALSARPNR